MVSPALRVHPGVRLCGLLPGAGAAGPAGSAWHASLVGLGFAAGRGRRGRPGRRRVAGGHQALSEYGVMTVIAVRGLRKDFTVRVKAGRLRRTKRVVSAV